MRVKIEEVDATVEIEVPRDFWRYLFAGLVFAEIEGSIEVASATTEAVQQADALLAELEKGGGDA